MSNELTKPQSIEEAVRDRVRTVLFAAIPDDEIDRLVNNEWKRFFEKPVKRDRWDVDRPSSFEGLVSGLVREHLTSRIKDRIVERCSEIQTSDIDTVIAELAPQLWQAVQVGIIKQVSEVLKQAIGQTCAGGY